MIHVWFIVEKGAPGLKLNAPLFEGVKDANALVRGSWGAKPASGPRAEAGRLRRREDADERVAGHEARDAASRPRRRHGRRHRRLDEHVDRAHRPHRRRQGLRHGRPGGLLLDDERRLAQRVDQLRAAERVDGDRRQDLSPPRSAREVARGRLPRGRDRRSRSVEIDLDEPGPRDVLVRMAAVGICGTELHSIRGEWERPTPSCSGTRAPASSRRSVTASLSAARRRGRALVGAVVRRLRRLPARPAGGLHQPPPGDRQRHARRRHDGDDDRRRDALPRHRDRLPRRSGSPSPSGARCRSATACRSRRRPCSAAPR